MPILRVEIVSATGENKKANLAGLIADEVGDILASKPGGTWVSTHWWPAEDYAENGGGPPENVRPVFVEILLAKLPSPEEMERQVKLITTALAKICDRPPENVHVLYLPAARERMAFGGQLIT